MADQQLGTETTFWCAVNKICVVSMNRNYLWSHQEQPNLINITELKLFPATPSEILVPNSCHAAFVGFFHVYYSYFFLFIALTHYPSTGETWTGLLHTVGYKLGATLGRKVLPSDSDSSFPCPFQCVRTEFPSTLKSWLSLTMINLNQDLQWIFEPCLRGNLVSCWFCKLVFRKPGVSFEGG